MPIVQALDESYTFIIKQINLDYVICKIDLNITNTKVNFNQFNYLIESINLKNFTKVTQDTFFFKIRNIIMRNNDVEIIEEKGIDIDYQFKSSTENIITFKSTDIKIKLTQNDIYNIILALKEKKKDNIKEKEKDKDKDSVITFTTNNSTVNNFLENNLTTDMLKQINNNYTGDINTNNFFGLSDDFFNLNTNGINTKGNNENSNGINTPQNNNNSIHEENKINNVKVLNNSFKELSRNNYKKNQNNTSFN